MKGGFFFQLSEPRLAVAAASASGLGQGGNADSKVIPVTFYIMPVGIAAFLKEQGAAVTVRDIKSPEELGERAEKLAELGVHLIAGEQYMENFTEDYIFRFH